MSDVLVISSEIMSNTARSRIVHDYVMIGMGWEVSCYEVLFRQ